MKKNFMIFSLILLSVLVSYAVVFWYSAKQKTQGTQIDIAGRNRMLSQRIGSMALLTDTDNEAQSSVAKEEMRKAIVLMDETLSALKNGGFAPGVEGNIVLPPAPAIIVPKINEIADFFKGHKEIAHILLNESRLIESSKETKADSASSHSTKVIINPKFKESLDRLRQRLVNGTLLKMNIELTEMFAHEAMESKRSFVLMLIILVAIDIAILWFAFSFLKRTLKPIESLTTNIITLSEGHIPEPIKADRVDEIGKMAIALNTLSDNMNSATEFAKNVGEGNLETQVQVFNGKGDLSQSLYVMRDNLKKVTEEDKKRNWATEGLARFSDILRASNDLKTLGENIISNLVKYTGSNQGSLFIVNNSDPADEYLELLASYAFNRKKFLEKKLLPGEGLAGQAYLEKETIFLKVVPQNYISITSGLGEANPSSILIVPLKLNEKITGIVEIASFKEYLPHEISFVEKLAENIASVVMGVKVNEHTQRLLQVSQQQTEELKAQEEEMRQNMEELKATQETIARKEMEAQAQAEELRATVEAEAHRAKEILHSNEQLETQRQAMTELIEKLRSKEDEAKVRESVFSHTTILSEADKYGAITFANSKLCEVSKYDKEELIGKSHNIFRHPDMPKELFKVFWNTIKSGNVFRGIIKNRAKDGSYYWVDASIVPVKDENGNISRFIGARYHIEDDAIAETLYQKQVERMGLMKSKKDIAL